MEPNVERAFTDEVRAEAANRFGTRPADLKLLGDHENYVFGFVSADGKRQVLRITHPSHRSAGQILSELHWVNYLRDNGVAIAGALPSTEGNLLESVGGEPFHVVSFEYAPGKPPGEADWNPDLWQQWGALQALTHRLAASYELPEDMEPRFSFFEEPYVANADDNFAGQPDVLAKWQEHKSHMEALPTDPAVYGLIHTDLYQANFHVHDGQLVIFDSDDCGYAWFAEDISSSIYYGVGHPASGDDRAAWASKFLPAYWRGYQTEHDLSPDWLELLPLFLMGRSLVIYSMLHTKWEIANLTPGQADDIAFFKRRVTTGEAWWTDVDFRSLADHTT